MDPYLERHWRDVHARLVLGACNMLQRQLGGTLRARIDERLVVERDEGAARSIYPDVRVYEGYRRSKALTPDSGVAIADPLIVKIPVVEEYTERFVQLLDIASGGRVVTIIEFLSPSNKIAGEGQRKYIEKQQEALDADVNLVEIDLTRRGERTLACPGTLIPSEWAADYVACTWRAQRRGEFELFRFPLREKLLAMPVPLRPSDPDVFLNLQELIDRAYEEGVYDDLDYTLKCDPPLNSADEKWADELLRAACKR